MSNTAMATVQSGQLEAQDKQIEAIQRIASQSTPKDEIRTRKGRGGMAYKYVDGPYVIRTLNEAFGHNWDFEADNEEVINFNGQPFEVRCRGRLTVRLAGQAVTKVQYGSQAIEFIKDKQGNIIAPVTIGDAFKGAATDAMKKCASLLGVALDLYDSDYRADKYEAEPEPVRNVRMEGAQPTEPKRQAAGSAGTRQILGLIAGLKWDGAKVKAWMEDKHSYAIESDDFAGVFDSFDSAEQQKIIAALKAEFNNR